MTAEWQSKSQAQAGRAVALDSQAQATKKRYVEKY
jgi:hypothetical protein